MTQELIIENNMITQCTSRQEEVAVPDGVACIGAGAFKGCASVKKILLPDSVEIIGAHAFKGCRQLETISMPQNLKEIGEYAFHRCHHLKEIALPHTVKALGNCVFLYCDSLRRIEMPGVTEFGRQTFLNDVNLEELVLSEHVNLDSIRDCFTGCNKISKITLAGNLQQTTVIENIVDILSGNTQTMPVVRKIVQDIYSILKIEDRTLAEYLNNVKNVELPEGITAIGKSCFYDKRGIKSVVFPKSLQKIGARAFRNCIGLEKVKFLQDDVEIEEDAFLNCSSLHELELPNDKSYQLSGLKELSGSNIPGLARQIHAQILDNFVISGTMLIKYRGCESKVAVPDGITIIGQRAFAGNEAIDRIELPDTVACIERGAFMDCVVMQSIQLSPNLEEIEESAFENCVKLIRVHLPDRLSVIPASCFKRCFALQEVYRDETHSGDSMSFNDMPLNDMIQGIEDLAFYGCRRLKYINLPETLQKIGDMAFYGCSGLKDIHFPQTLKEIGKLAFTKSGVPQSRIQQCLSENNIAALPDEGKNDVRLRNVFANADHAEGKIEIAEGTEYIEAFAFFGNDEITAVKFPDSLKEVGESAFYGCRNLKTVIFPKGKIILRRSCFEKCIRLEAVTCTAEYVPQRAFAWCRMIKELQISGLQKIHKEAFQGCMGLRNVRLEAVSYIGKNAFAMCDGLRTITVGGSVFLDDFSFLDCGNLNRFIFLNAVDQKHFMKSGTFRGCTGLTHIEYCGECWEFGGYDSLFHESIPQFMKRIYASALSVFEIDAKKRELVSYGGLAERVVIPFGLKAVGREAFRDKENLRELVIPDSIEEIGPRAFDKTQWLQNQKSQNPMVLWKDILIDGTACEGRVIIPSNVRKISGWAFVNNMHLTELQFTGKTYIEEYAFRNCIYLEKIILEDGSVYSLAALSDRNRPQPPAVTQIVRECYNCFKMEGDLLVECTGNIEQLKLPRGIRRIGTNAFKDSNLLTEIILNGEVTEIADGAFMDCKWLQSVKNAASLKSIGKKAFSGCIRLKEISGLQAKLEYIGERAFEDCIALVRRNCQETEERAWKKALKNRELEDYYGTDF